MTTTVYTGAYLPVVTGDTAAWGGKLNTQTFVTFDSAIGGIASQTVTTANVTLSATQSGMMILALNGLLTGNRTVTTSRQGICVVENYTTGNYTLTYTNGTGSSVVVPQGFTSVIASDAVAGCFLVSQPPPSSVALTGTLSVAGATTLSSTISVTDAASFAGLCALAEIATPTAPAAGTMNLYGYAGDCIASQTPGGVQKIYGKDPSVQRLTSGSGAAYTPSAGMVRIRVRMVAAGGGGGGSVGDGGTGGTTSFGSWTCIGGFGGFNVMGGGSGGSGGTNGTGTLIIRMAGNGGAGGAGVNGASGSGAGGAGPFGGGGSAASQVASGNPAAANSGAGGGGVWGNNARGGGGGGEYVEFWMTAAQVGASVTYTIGASGAAGTGGGGAGGTGAIIVEEYYN